jgi:hypothetical protein
MDPVSNIDQIVLLLRQRLTQRERAASGRVQRHAGAQPAAPTVDALAALAAAGGVSERQLRRALVQTLLAEQFGADLINDARFQQVVDQVTETIDAHPGAARLIGRVTQQLRGAARAT